MDAIFDQLHVKKIAGISNRRPGLSELKQWIRDIWQGPDGLIYLLTEEIDGAVLKIEPAD